MVERDVSDGTTERTWSRSVLSAGRTSNGTGTPACDATVTCALRNFSPRWRQARPASPAAIAKAHNTNSGVQGLLVDGVVSCTTSEGVTLGYVGEGCDGTTIAGVLGRLDVAVGISVSQVVVNEFSLNDGVGVGGGKFGGITMYELIGGSVGGSVVVGSVVVGSVVVGSVVVGSVVVGSVVVGSVVVGSVVVGSVVVGCVEVGHGSASA